MFWEQIVLIYDGPATHVAGVEIECMCCHRQLVKQKY